MSTDTRTRIRNLPLKPGRAVAALLVLIAFSMSAGAVNKTGTSDVDVTVNSKTLVDISPQSVSFSGDPGTMSDITDNLTVENVGSTDITSVWVNVSQPASDPFGTGSAANYDAGNFVGVRPDDSGALKLVDRIDFNKSVVPYVQLPSGCTNNNASGRIRLDNEEFFWCAETGGSGNYVDGTLHYSDAPHNKSQTGDTQLNNNAVLSSTANGEYGAVDITLPSNENGDENYCALVDKEGEHIRIIGQNPVVDTSNVCTNDEYIVSNTLNPGEFVGIDTRARIPFGVPTGSVSTGEITVIASDTV